MGQQPEESIIIQQVLQGNTMAYTTLVLRYQAYVYTIALRYVNDTAVAEELAQDVFVKAYRMLAGFKGGSKFSTWLYTIVNSTCLSYLRSNKPRIILLEQAQLTAIAEEHAHELPGTIHEKKEQKKILELAIARLNPVDAQIVTLFYLAEQSVEEIAIIVNLTTDNIKVRLFRSRQKLKEIVTTQFKNSI